MSAALLAVLLAAPAAHAEADLDGQHATVQWRNANLGLDRPLVDSAATTLVSRDFTVGDGPGVTDLGFYPSLSLQATPDRLEFSFSAGWCCLLDHRDAFVGPVVTFTSLPDDQDLQVTIGDGTIPLTPADVQVDGNRIAVDLHGRDIGGGRLTLLVHPGSNLAERVTLGLIGIGLITLGILRRRWLA